LVLVIPFSAFGEPQAPHIGQLKSDIHYIVMVQPFLFFIIVIALESSFSCAAAKVVANKVTANTDHNFFTTLFLGAGS
jgi:hypothetical protein